MKSFDHVNVLTLLGVCVDTGGAPYIVMPFMSHGSLLSYLKKERHNLTVPEGTDIELVSSTKKQLLSMCLQVAEGMREWLILQRISMCIEILQQETACELIRQAQPIMKALKGHQLVALR